MRRRQYSPSLTELICNQDWRGVRSRIRTAHGRREVRTPNPLGYPIHDACDYGAPVAVIKALLDVYPEGSRRHSMDGQLPIHMEFLRYPFPRQAVIRALLDANPDSAFQPNVSGRSWSMLFLQHERNELGSGEDQSSSLQESSTGEEENRSSSSDRDSDTTSFARRSSSLEPQEESKSQESDRESDQSDIMMTESISSRSTDNAKQNQDSDSKSEDSQDLSERDLERESVSTLAASDGSSEKSTTNAATNQHSSNMNQSNHRPHELVGRRVVMSTNSSHAIRNLETMDGQGRQVYSHQQHHPSRDTTRKKRTTTTQGTTRTNTKRNTATTTSLVSSDGCGSRDSIGSSSGDDEPSSCQHGEEDNRSARYGGKTLSSLSCTDLAQAAHPCPDNVDPIKFLTTKDNPDASRTQQYKTSRETITSTGFKGPPNLKCPDGEDWSKSDGSEKGSVVSSMTGSDGVSSRGDTKQHRCTTFSGKRNTENNKSSIESETSEGTSFTGTASDHSVSSTSQERERGSTSPPLHETSATRKQHLASREVTTMFGSDDSCSSDHVYQVSDQSSCRQGDCIKTHFSHGEKPPKHDEGSSSSSSSSGSGSGDGFETSNKRGLPLLHNKRKRASESNRILQEGEKIRRAGGTKSPRRTTGTNVKSFIAARRQEAEAAAAFQEGDYKVASSVFSGEDCSSDSQNKNKNNKRRQRLALLHDEQSYFGGSDTSSQSREPSVHRIAGDETASSSSSRSPGITTCRAQLEDGRKRSL